MTDEITTDWVAVIVLATLVAAIVAYLGLTVITARITTVQTDDPQQWCIDHGGEYDETLARAGYFSSAPTPTATCELANGTAVFFVENKSS